MTKVPEYNLPKFGTPPQSKQEKTNSLYWRYKKGINPKPVHKASRVKLIDKHLISDDITRLNHIRDISKEI